MGFTGELLVVGKSGHPAMGEDKQPRGWVTNLRDQQALRLQDIDKTNMNRLIWATTC